MKQLFQKWNQISLILRIAVGLLIGAVLGVLVPQASILSILGDIFVGALKAIAPILVFVLIISALTNANKNIGPQFRTVIALYIVTTLIASLIAVIGSYLFPITLKLADAVSNEAPSGIGEVLGTLIRNMVQNPVTSIINANYIGILTWAVILGIALREVASDSTKELLTNISDAVSMTVRWIISFAPFGILGLVFSSVSTSGLSIFADYGKLLAVLVGCMLTVALVVNPMIVFFMLRKNPYPLVFRCLRESGLTAFFTRSSAANIPVNMQLCERLGLDKDIYSISIPLGATINMDGAAITIAIMTLAAANTMGIAVDLPSAFVLCVLATLAACGASGVAGGSLLLIPMACSLFGISNDIAMQVVGVGFIIGVVQDSVETALNSAGDVLFAATAEFYEWRKQGKEIRF
ncbi:MAG: serine/threonine transporter SstT [Clostridium sp.]|nr:serine/threonine transporter SstT [Clostridium sp.]MDY5484289.1 serine/threonine transporter SstT [Clostridium sp.]